MVVGSRTYVSRADLVRSYGQWGEPLLDNACAIFGYERVKQKQTQQALDFSVNLSVKEAPKQAPEVQEQPSSELICWHVTERIPRDHSPEATQIPDWLKNARVLTKEEVLATADYPEPPRQPIVPWSKLWPYLKQVLSHPQETGELDAERFVDGFAKGKVITRIPRKQAAYWAPTCQILIDYHPDLVPYWDDFRQVVADLLRLRGKAGLIVRFFTQGPDGQCQDALEEETAVEPYEPPPPGTPILVLSDLGSLRRDDGSRDAWRRFREKLGDEFVPIALLPTGPKCLQRGLPKGYQSIFWDRNQSLRAKRYRGPIKPSQGERGLAELFTLISAALRVEPNLLRALRCLLPAHRCGSGHEALIWNHADVQNSLVAMVQHSSRLEQDREAFSGLDTKLAQKAVALIKVFHGKHALPLREMEALLASKLLGEEVENLPFVANFMQTLLSEAAPTRGMLHWFQGIAGRQHAGMWAHKEMNAAWCMAIYPFLENNATVPAGIDPHDHSWLNVWNQEETHWQLVQSGNDLLLRKDSPKRRNKLSSVVTFSTHEDHILIDEKERLKKFPLEACKPRPHCANPWTIQLPKERMTLTPCKKPWWASAWGRDDLGLWGTLKDDQRKLRWWEPGSLPLEEGGTAYIKQGCWLDEQQFFSFKQHGLLKPAWASGMGIDDYGIYADFVVKHIRQRFRWLMPDRFLMGSPVDEPERFDREIQHEVLLTRGFWMAETACTQELWTTVMGENPSYFEGEDLPAERVSWHDIQGFIKNLPEGFGLPTEAEWEYACRAGTTTSFSFGQNITTDQVNYDGNYPYINGEKGEYRKKTVPVRSLPANPWGLYQMHGNVSEWCLDWFGDFDSSSAVDPEGPVDGEGRVLRGGSWIINGKFVRSASRNFSDPDYRDDYIGFRLVSDQKGLLKRKRNGKGA